MPDSEAKKKWQKENTTMIRMRLNHNTDADILAALQTKPSVAGFIKDAIREKLKREKTK